MALCAVMILSMATRSLSSGLLKGLSKLPLGKLNLTHRKRTDGYVPVRGVDGLNSSLPHTSQKQKGVTAHAVTPEKQNKFFELLNISEFA